MTDKEKIKSEFEKRSILCKKARIDLRKDINIAYYEGKETAYKEAVLYIDSLQEEPVSEDLLKASIEFAKGFGEWHYAMPCFQAGAEWGKNQAMAEIQAQKPAELGENRSKELSLSLQIQACLNTASDELYAKGKPLYSEKRIEDIHKCMLMWQKLHNAYFYHNLVEWSEEDERWFKEIELMCLYFSNDTDYREKFFAWLKSLKDRVQPQTKQVWCEEVESRITTICTYLQDYARLSGSESRTIRINEYCDWLKSLRFKNRWKPSDEQIKAVKEAACYSSVFSEKTIDNLISLSKQLKKLKG